MKSSQNSSCNPLSRQPLFSIALAFAVGIFLAEPAGLSALLPCVLLVAAVIASLFDEKARTVSVLAVFICAGYLCASLYLSGASAKSLGALYDNGWLKSGDPVQIEGVLRDHPQSTVDGMFLQIAAERVRYKRELIETNGNLRVFVPLNPDLASDCANGFYAGNRVRVSARLKREEEFRNPGTMSSIESLERRGLEATGSLKSCLLLQQIDSTHSLFAPVYASREWLTGRILETQDRETAGIVIAALLGNKNFLSKQTGTAFRESGTFHVLIISGLHITFIGGLILFFARRLTGNRFRQFLISNSLLWSYAILVGLQLPVLRAAIMYTVFLLSYAIYRQGSSLNSLGAASLVILVWRPTDLQNPSFQLTFLSIFAIVGFAFPVLAKIKQVGAWYPTSGEPIPPKASRPFRIFAEILYWSELSWSQYIQKQTWNGDIEKSVPGKWFADTFIQRVFRRLFEIVFVTFSVQLFLLPLLILNFHMIGTASFVSNVFAGFTVAFQIAGALVTVLISSIDKPSGLAFAGVIEFVSHAVLSMQEFLSGEVLTPLRVPVYRGAAKLIYAVYFIPLIGLSVCLMKWNPFGNRLSTLYRTLCVMSLIGTAAASLTIVLSPMSEPPPDGRFTVHFLDVGQGDSAFLVFPDGTTMLIDGGGQRSFRDDEEVEFERDFAGIGERVVSEFLWELGYEHIDFIVSTHPDADHINGLTDVIKNFRVGTILVGKKFVSIAEYDRMAQIAHEKRVPIIEIGEGTRMEIDGAVALFLNPQRGLTASPGNDDSIVVRITYGSKSFLFTGDIETNTEERLVGVGFRLDSDVVKVPHHGSRTSSGQSFINSVSASYAVVPVGLRSPYGHPQRDVIRRWEEAGAKVVTLGTTGTATFSTNGSDLQINYFTGP